MRINQFVAQAAGMSRRNADEAIKQGRVTLNGQSARLGTNVGPSDVVTLDGQQLNFDTDKQTIMLNKPAGYVCSREGQGAKTIYDLLPKELHHLKPAGRLDKDSSGLLLLTNDGKLAHELTHPSFQKEKIYEIGLNKPLAEKDRRAIERGVELDDGTSALQLEGAGKLWTAKMHEGRNRQIRRTFAACGYHVEKLHRTKVSGYDIGNLSPGSSRHL